MEDRQVLVLYGSQTGTAHDVADRVTREAKRRHFATRVLSMDDYNVTSLIQERLVIFVCSTTGQGDPPDNMRMFWKFLLRRDLPPTSLSGLKFAVLGLGDSSYQKFNVVGKRLQKRIEQLGGQAIHSLGLADDHHDLGVDAVVTPWLSELWDVLLTMYPLAPGLDVIASDVCPTSKYKVQFLDTTNGPGGQHEVNVSQPQDQGVVISSVNPPSSLCPFHARLISNQRVTHPDHFQDVRLIKLDIAGSGISYSPGDVVMIQPQNSADSVEKFLSILGLDPDKQFQLSQNDPDSPLPPQIPNPCSVRWLATHYLDINSVPRRSFFELLWYHAGGEPDSDAELEKEKLAEFCTPQGQEELYNYCNRVKRNIREVLEDFVKTSAQIPFEYLLDLIPPLQPRAFSIASSPKAHPDQLHVLMAVVRYQTKLHFPRLGVCSNWLANVRLQDGDTANKTRSEPVTTVPIWVKRGTIRFPQDPNIPLVMVGPGTGLAPFRSAIHERCAEGKGDLVLFFGCRSESKDFFCAEEWKHFTHQGLLKLLTAFSRDQEEKIYVQHRIREEGSLVWKMINEQSAYFYIAGNAKSMPDDVKESLRDVISIHGNMTQTEAASYIQQLEKNRRFQVEAWS
ncbi:NADPH-dependent diflavin oxidoreductase 1 [Elysia marginata]|uniref:NADPH-dependent diflavin oxidoreductase 1 n=1 Tax=Elysia marginata TaxID=1093978 RepID=A0AAV4JMK3_9GAST|nr:NADPH-dependent diflavin oxidoreductase 1 [Elysia marginata]